MQIEIFIYMVIGALYWFVRFSMFNNTAYPKVYNIDILMAILYPVIPILLALLWALCKAFNFALIVLRYIYKKSVLLLKVNKKLTKKIANHEEYD